MWSEILKVIPKISAPDMKRMENDLSKRFANVAKKFGGGLKNALTGGGVFALAAGALNKLLNPLTEINETIKNTLKRADDLSTDAKEFGTTEGKLFKLQTLGKSFGIDENVMNVLLTKFQSSLVAARQPGAEPSAVSEFASIPDVADAFYKFAQSMKNAPRDVQVRAQEEVFGERVMGKAREFFQEDLDARLSKLNLKGSETYTPRLQKAADVAGLDEILRAQNDAKSFFDKSGKITESMVIEQNRAQALQDQMESQRLNSYKDLQRAANTAQEIKNEMQKGLDFVSKMLPDLVNGVKFSIDAIKPYIEEIAGAVKSILNSPFIRGVKNTVGSWFK